MRVCCSNIISKFLLFLFIRRVLKPKSANQQDVLHDLLRQVLPLRHQLLNLRMLLTLYTLQARSGRPWDSWSHYERVTMRLELCYVLNSCYSACRWLAYVGSDWASCSPSSRRGCSHRSRTTSTPWTSTSSPQFTSKYGLWISRAHFHFSLPMRPSPQLVISSHNIQYSDVCSQSFGIGLIVLGVIFVVVGFVGWIGACCQFKILLFIVRYFLSN